MAKGMKQAYWIITALLVASFLIVLGYEVESNPLTRMKLSNVVVMNNTVFFNVSVYSEKADNLVIAEEVNGVTVLEKTVTLNAFEEKTIAFNASLQEGENEVAVKAYYENAEYNGYGSEINPYYVFFKVVA